MRALLWVWLAITASAALAAPVPKNAPPSEADVRRKLARYYWEVVRWERPGTESPLGTDRIYWEFDEEGHACETYDTGQVEQSKCGFRLDATCNPMRLDLVSGAGREMRVNPGIFRFDGEDLIWVQGGEVTEAELKAEKPAAPVRPNTFTPQAPRSWTKLTLRRLTTS